MIDSLWEDVSRLHAKAQALEPEIRRLERENRRLASELDTSKGALRLAIKCWDNMARKDVAEVAALRGEINTLFQELSWAREELRQMRQKSRRRPQAPRHSATEATEGISTS